MTPPFVFNPPRHFLATKDVGGLKVYVVRDESPCDPREDDNLGTILYVSDRYTLGDKKVSPEEIREVLARRDVVALPIYAYIHSGTTIRTSSGSNPFAGMDPGIWDSGMSGIIYVDRDTYLKDGHTRFDRKKAESILRSEVERYDHYLTGAVYGYQVFDPETGDCVESCWGYYGEDEYCLAEGVSVATDLWPEVRDRRVSAVTSWTKRRDTLVRALVFAADRGTYGPEGRSEYDTLRAEIESLETGAAFQL